MSHASSMNDVSDQRPRSFSGSEERDSLLVGSAISPRSDPSRTIRMSSGPGYRLLTENVPNQEQTMVSQRFNKLSPFVTEHGNNPNAHPFLRQSLA